MRTGEEFAAWIERLKEAPDSDEFRKRWREYIDTIKVGSMVDYWITQLIDRWGGPGGIFLALKQGKTLYTEGDLFAWQRKRAAEYEWREE